MNKVNETSNSVASDNSSTNEQTPVSAIKTKNRGRKRKRRDSDGSSDFEDALPDNALEVEKNLHASAIKNNLDDVSVKKILKKVVTNDHVLALVKLREQEEASTSKGNDPQPKLTRAKAKELMKVSPQSAPQSAPWNLALTPIKHIPVKTRPEVEALITKELPEDEDDDEYQPTHDDVPSDDDQTLESCSDFDSQPPTPATPSSHILTSPQVRTDGPFKVPPVKTPSTPARRKLAIHDEDEEATIALRTRSKINLSATPIEHIESSFVPPDDVPTPIRDDLWDQFLVEVLNPAEVSRHEDDDEADPEYNVAADPDAHDEDDEAALDGIIRISKKELNDLVTELFAVMPPGEDLTENLAEDILINTNPNQLTGHWEGKQEPISDEENHNPNETKTRPERVSLTRFSIGKSEPEDEVVNVSDVTERDEHTNLDKGKEKAPLRSTDTRRKVVRISVEEHRWSVQPADSEEGVPPPLLRSMRQGRGTQSVHVTVDAGVKVLPEQIQILQQQIRQHVQLATSNFLQLYVNPAHWNVAPTYKHFLEQLDKIVSENPKSVVNVCNLRPALDLVNSWESTVSEDTPENKEMVEFIQKEAERSRRRFHQNALYVGDFPELLMKVISNSAVFLYPYLLPAMPYRADANRKFGYRRSEDHLIALGLDQFWQYIEDNPELFKRPKGFTPNTRWGYTMACTLVCKHMFPWITPKLLMGHIWKAKRTKDNPIQQFFATRKITPVTHKLLAYNPKLTLYEQPEHEMPRIWVRYLAKTSQRFRSYYYTRRQTGEKPEGVPIAPDVELPEKNPLPSEFTKIITKNRSYNDPADRQNNNVQQNETLTLGNFVKHPGPVLTINPICSTNITNIHPGVPGPVLTINPIISTNITNIISTNNSKDNIPPGKVPISAISNKNSSKEVIKTEPAKSNTQLMGKLIPVCVNNLIDPNTTQTLNNFSNNNVTEEQNLSNKNFALFQNMFRVVQTSIGSYLVPLTVIQNTTTTNSINGPIVSTKDASTIGNDSLEPSRKSIIEEVLQKTEALKYHCKCCILLKKICKERQSRITDFFKPKQNENKKCDCTQRVFPKVSKRLKLLVNSYKTKAWCEQRRIQNMLASARKGEKGKDEKIEDCDIEDIAFVSTFQIKLIQRAALARNAYIKKRIYSIFFKFDPDTGDPAYLAEKLMEIFGVELIDVYKEFLAFLTPDQADKIDMFKDYFVFSCMGDLVKEVEAEIQDLDKRNVILSHLSVLFSDNLSTPCELCFGILSKLTETPRLSKYVFSLFPHRVSEKERIRCRERNKLRKTLTTDPNQLSKELEQQDNLEGTSTDTQPQSQTQLEEPTNQDQELCDADEPGDNLTICDDTSIVVEYEADHSSSGEENGNRERTEVDDTTQDSGNVKSETPRPDDDPDDSTIETDITIGKTEFHNLSDSTIMSPLVMSEDEPVKAEHPEWKRDEDKLILEILLQYLTPQERKEKTILEILDEKNVYQLIADGLPHKSIDDVKERVMYVLEILVLSDY